MLTTAKDHMVSIIAAIEVDGVTIGENVIYRDAEAANRKKPSQYAMVLSGTETLKKQWAKMAKDWRAGKLSVKVAKYDRTLPLVVTIAGHTEDWVDQVVTELLKALPRYIQDGEDLVEVNPRQIGHTDSEAVLAGKTHAAVLLIEYTKTIATWETQPAFDTVQIDVPDLGSDTVQ